MGEMLAQGRLRLAGAGIPSPSTEARLLLAETLEVSPGWVLAHPEAEVPEDRRLGFLSRVERRANFEPVAYILGHKEFFGLDLEVGPAVLVPRPETELLVERALSAAGRLAAASGGNPRAVDLGTGSGAIAVALAVHQPRLRLLAVDRSPDALAVARRNAARHGVADRIEFMQGDLLDGVEGGIDLLAANLPYVPFWEIEGLMPDVRLYEPRDALDGGPDGTRLVRQALEQAMRKMSRPASLLFEIGEGQGERLREHAFRCFPDAEVQVARDYAGFERILSIDLR